jgi:hypothetical protein
MSTGLESWPVFKKKLPPVLVATGMASSFGSLIRMLDVEF